jgi:hypothetical protein
VRRGNPGSFDKHKPAAARLAAATRLVLAGQVRLLSLTRQRAAARLRRGTVDPRGATVRLPDTKLRQDVLGDRDPQRAEFKGGHRMDTREKIGTSAAGRAIATP